MSTNISFQRIVLVKESAHRYNINRKISEPADAVAAFNAVFHMNEESQELFAVLFLNVRNVIVGVHLISRGSVDAAVAHPREIFKAALLHNASNILVAHNHPSGDVNPSREDDVLTKQLTKSGSILGIPVLDHVIIGDDSFYSYREANRLE